MVSDNKNINRLTADTHEEPTSELEVLSLEMVPTDEELEMDANTFSLEQDDTDVTHLTTLRSDLRIKDERIADLQYDIEQLRARWTGLEKEINAREELTEILQQDLKAAHKSLAAKDKQLSRFERDLTALTGKHDAAVTASEEAEAKANELAEELDELRRRDEANARKLAEVEAALNDALSAPTDEELAKEIKESRLAIAELSDYIDGRKADWDRMERDVDTLTAQLADKDVELERQGQRLAERESTLADIERERGRLASALDEARAQNEALTNERRQLASEIDAFRDGELASSEKLIAEQAGTIAGSRQRLAELQARCARSESYADELRHKLTAAQDEVMEAADRHGSLEQEFAAATAEVRSLEGQLESAQRQAEQLTQERDELQRDLDEQIRALRFDLEEAQDTIVEHESINEQLTSELIEQRAFKQALEERLAKVEAKYSVAHEELEQRTEELTKQIEDFESKIQNKDNAISALLSELANKSRSIDSIDEIEHVIHEIDDRMSERIDDRVVTDRDRPTRLLIGNIDGQELRFPLFKDRLTIGRTVQNDIQLRAQYISRRHAVVLTDEEGTKIVDWGSKNGVYVNNARVSEQLLKNGDKVTIGTADFIYEERSRR